MLGSGNSTFPILEDSQARRKARTGRVTQELGGCLGPRVGRRRHQVHWVPRAASGRYGSHAVQLLPASCHWNKGPVGRGRLQPPGSW